MTAYPRVRTVVSSDLRAGDVVWTHGMRVRLTAPPKTYAGAYGPVTRVDGAVLNREDAIRAGIVPESWLREYAPDGRTLLRSDSWAVQGNDHATWQVEDPPPCEHGLSASLCAGPGHYPPD